jgi:uncharacterized delta-60 repeat protein
LEDRLCLSPISSDGTLDVSFDYDGLVTTDFGSGSDMARSVAVQADGKIVAAGAWDNGQHRFGLARYHADGSLDTSFDGDGKVTTFSLLHGIANSVALQADGKIVAAGTVWNSTANGDMAFALARYNADGSLDTSFNGTGTVTTGFGSFTTGNSVAVGADGRIVVAGSTGYAGARVAIACYNPDGSLDITFDGDGKLTTGFRSGAGSAYGVAVQADDKIVIAGNDNYFGAQYPHNFRLARLNADGSLDTSFGGTGEVTTSFETSENDALSVAVQADGKIVAAGYTGYEGAFNFAVARYNPDGSLDGSFHGDGKVATDIGARDIAYSVALQADGKVVVAGDTSIPGTDSFAVVRYNADGSLDPTFDGDGKLTTDFNSVRASGAYSVAVQADGKIVAAGYAWNTSGNADFAVARYSRQVVAVTIDIQPGNAAYNGSPYLESNIIATLTPDTAEGTISYSFLSDAAGTNPIADPTHGGTYYVQGRFTSSDPSQWTDADSAIAGFTIVKADAAISVTPYSVTYHGAAQMATGTATGVESPIPADLSSLLDLSGTAHTHAGTYLDTWTFAGNDDYNAASGTVTDVITQATLAGFATTQNALNIAKQGYMNVNISGITGFVGSDTIASVFGSMTFQLTIGANVYTFQPIVTVVSSTEVHLAYTLRGGTDAGDALRHDLALIDLDATSASNAQYEMLRITAQNQDYSFVDDFFTRLFCSTK